MRRLSKKQRRIVWGLVFNGSCESIRAIARNLYNVYDDEHPTAAHPFR